MNNLSKYFDHTILKPDAKAKEIRKLCLEAIQYDFYSVCVNGVNIEMAKEILKTSDVKISTVVGFPLGATTTRIKSWETEEYIKLGADEIDMVINIGKLKEGDFQYIEKEVERILTICRKNHVLLKCIVETCLLNKEEKIEITKLLTRLNVDFIKTSTGFSKGGAEISDIKLIKSITEDKIKIKASGGIRDLKSTLDMISAGADRIGASASASIMEEYLK